MSFFRSPDILGLSLTYSLLHASMLSICLDKYPKDRHYAAFVSPKYLDNGIDLMNA